MKKGILIPNHLRILLSSALSHEPLELRKSHTVVSKRMAACPIYDQTPIRLREWD